MTLAHAEADFSWIRPRRFEGYARDADGNRMYVMSVNQVRDGQRVRVVRDGEGWVVTGKQARTKSNII